ncbi:hypothetical protein NSE_0805 [Neorickettsia sennetsu str. Miyayama]|uniref:Uncharacterized protein n=1 Tax=Ehrlichia sennetsu (strain ATCC VR-367 / Miyayama) TaxID=222891 RepID=Q2GCW8_EHRS3|nr:hypothetical protein NSE_0805 [Neorickettsia sennetsu str. Miyayama]
MQIWKIRYSFVKTWGSEQVDCCIALVKSVKIEPLTLFFFPCNLGARAFKSAGFGGLHGRRCLRSVLFEKFERLIGLK